MELKIIRHKYAAEFFKGFYNEHEAASYSYQLQRMFESGSAYEGDYFVIEDNDIPLMNVEIYRNNTRRIWEKPPMIIGDPDKEKIRTALKLIFDFLEDKYYYGGQYEYLEIVVDSEYENSGILNELSKQYKYSTVYKKTVLVGDLNEMQTNVEDTDIKKFIDLDVNERFDLVWKNEPLVKVFPKIDPEKLYQDYLEEGYQSEKLWSELNQKAGFIMPVFTSGLKNKISLVNYHISKDIKNRKNVLSEFYNLILRICLNNEVEKVKIALNNSDKDFIDFFKDQEFIVINERSSYGK